MRQALLFEETEVLSEYCASVQCQSFSYLLHCIAFYYTLILVPKRVHKRLYYLNHNQRKAKKIFFHDLQEDEPTWT